MKISLILSFLFSSLILSAQVKEGSYECSLGKQYGYLMDHFDTDKGIVEDVMENMIGEYGKVKRNRKAKEWYCNACTINKIGSAPLDIYYKVEEGKDLVTTYVFVDNGEKFISSYNDKDAAEVIEEINYKIYLEIQREKLRKQIEDMEDELKKFEKDLSKLVKKNEGLHADIENYKENIRQAEKDIEQNLNDQEDKRIEIEQQKKVISKTTDKLNQVGRS